MYMRWDLSTLVYQHSVCTLTGDGTRLSQLTYNTSSSLSVLFLLLFSRLMVSLPPQQQKLIHEQIFESEIWTKKPESPSLPFLRGSLRSRYAICPNLLISSWVQTILSPLFLYLCKMEKNGTHHMQLLVHRGLSLALCLSLPRTSVSRWTYSIHFPYGRRTNQRRE